MTGPPFRYTTRPEQRAQIRRHLDSGAPLDNAQALAVLGDLETALAERAWLYGHPEATAKAAEEGAAPQAEQPFRDPYAPDGIRTSP